MSKKYNQPFFKARPMAVKPRPVAQDPAEQLDAMSAMELTAGINRILQALERKGVAVRDYDNRRRKIFRIQQVHGKYYFLAANEET